MKKHFIIFTIALAMFLTTSLVAKVQVGDVVNEKFETPHPYISGQALEKVFYWPNASYISLHFSQFELAPGDFLVVSDPAGLVSYKYDGKGKEVRGGAEVLSTFWASHIPGDTAIVKLVSHNPKAGFGFTVDKWVHGYEKEIVTAAFDNLEPQEGEIDLESICGINDKEWAKCYEGTTMYNKSKAVCRLLISGMYACTGWLLGSEGHIMTNNHCIESQTDASNTDFEFMAEGATCGTDCSSWFACPGTVEATSSTLIQTDTALDYSLVMPPTNVSGTYGYFQLRDTLPIVNERIYIPQHPSAYGKQIAVYSTDSTDASGYCEIYTQSTTPCSGGPGDIGYFADTEGGSSGSPVLAYSDHLVVALHHCAACPNRGVPIPSIISDLGSNLPANAIGGQVPQDPPAAPTSLGATAVACDQVNLAWTDNADNEDSFVIERSTDGSNYSILASVGANVTAYADTAAAGDTTYYYKVKATNTGGSSAYSNVANATTTTCPLNPPAAPSITTVEAKKRKLNVYWADNSNNETGFYVYRGLTSTNLDLVATVGANTTAIADSGLVSGVTYFYKVCAFNNDGETCSSVASGTPK